MIGAAGFDFVDLPVENPGDWSPPEVSRILSENDLTATVCAAIADGRDLTTTDTRIVESTQEYLRACVDAAAEVGAPIVAGPLYSPTGVIGPISPTERETIVARLAEHLLPVVQHAEQANVTLAIEPLNRFETSLFNTVAQTMELIRLLDRESVGLLLDTFHLNIEERDTAVAIRQAGSALKHVHACGSDRGKPGGDNVNWKAVRDALIDIGYTGAIAIESFTTSNTAIATATSIWRPLAESQDDIAYGGLSFLQELFSTQHRGG